MPRLGVLAFILSFLHLYYVEHVGSTATQEAHVYSYTSTLSLPGHSNLDRAVKGSILVKQRTLSARRKPAGSLRGKSRLLLHFVFDLDGTVEPLEGLVIRDENGLVENIILPSTVNSSDTRLNFFKAVVGIFNYRHSFEPGVEYDTSGDCRTFYAEVDDSSSEDKNSLDSTIVIDKQKVMCEPINQPLDAGLWSVSPILKESRVTHSWMRYHFNRENGVLVRARTLEQHKLSFTLEDDPSGKGTIGVSSEQMLELLEDGTTKNKAVMSKFANYRKPTTSNQVSTIAEEIFGPNYRFEHLALSVPRQSATSGCGIQSGAFEEQTHDSPGAVLTTRGLQEKFRQFESALEQPARISSVHASLQLLRFMRCLPSNKFTIQVAALALEFIPSSRRDVHRQMSTAWYKQLTDVLINCGTDTCMELLRQRLIKVTELAVFDKLGTDASRDVRAVRAYLMSDLWPSIAHLSNPSVGIFQEFTALCHHSLPAMENAFLANELEFENPYSCLLALSNMATRFRGKYALEKMLIGKVVETLREYITAAADGFEDDQFNRQKLLAAFTGAERVRDPSLAAPLLAAIKNPQIPSILRSVGLKTLGSLNYGNEKENIAIINSHLMEIVDSPTPGPFFKNEDDELVIKFGVFSVQLNIGTHPTDLARVLASFGQTKQWSLLASCRRLVEAWCREELLTEAACNCIKRGGPIRTDVKQPTEVCRPGLAAGWSGLAGTKTAGEINLISGDLIDHRPIFLADYSLQWVTGPYGEFRSSNLGINLIGPDSEAKLMGFHIYGDKLAALMGQGDTSDPSWLAVGFSFMHGSIPPRQIFSGGIPDVMRALFNAPNQPTPFCTTLRLPVDVRRYVPTSAGWVLRNDIQGATSLELSGALESSLFSQSGKSLVRTRAAVVIENIITIVTPDTNEATISSVVTGIGSAARLDFVTRMEMAGMPESICMSFQRVRATPVMRWSGEQFDSTVLGKREMLLRPLPKPGDSKNDFFEFIYSERLPPISYHLGKENAARCNKMGGSNDW